MDQNSDYVKFLNEMTLGHKTLKELDDIKCMELMIQLENKFKDLILASKTKKVVIYKKFIKYVKDEKGNILHSKMYFREREVVFVSDILADIRDEDHEALYCRKINFKFMKWVMELDSPPKHRSLKIIYDQYNQIRSMVIQKNLPLVVNRSKLFQFKSRKSSENPLEYVQIGAEGLIHSIDKFVPSGATFDQREFKAPAIGWIQSVLMEDAKSRTMLKTSTTDKRIMYRVNIARYRLGYSEIAKVLAFVQEKYPKATQEQIQSMILSENITSVDGTTEDRSAFSRHMQTDSAEEEIISSLMIQRVEKIAKGFSILERKALVLKGGISGTTVLSMDDAK